MAKLTIEDTTLTNIANSIREKTGKSEKLLPSQMPNEIKSIETGGGSYQTVNLILNDYGMSMSTSDFLTLFTLNSETNSIEPKTFSGIDFQNFYDYQVENVIINSYLLISSNKGISDCLETILESSDRPNLSIYKIIESSDYMINFQNNQTVGP